MKRSSHPLEQVACPNCKSKNIHSTCGRIERDTRIRYKRCLDCDCKFKTEQLITPEKIVAKIKRSGPYNSVLTEDDVLFIRQQLIKKAYSQLQLAIRFGVDTSCISKIQTGRTWKNVTAKT